MSPTHLLISKISHTCQEICDIKRTRKPKSIVKANNVKIMDEGEMTDQKETPEPDSNSFARGDSNDGDGSDGTYSSHSILCPHEPSNLCTPSHHAPSLPSPSPAPFGSTLSPPGDRSPTPASKITTLTPASLW